jgi:hypothetical protein
VVHFQVTEAVFVGRGGGSKSARTSPTPSIITGIIESRLALEHGCVASV